MSGGFVAVLLAVVATLMPQSASEPAPVSAIEEAMRRDPNDRGNLFDLGFALVRDGEQLEQARSLFQRAEQLHGPHWYAALELGIIAELLGDLRGARAEYERSITLSGTEPVPPAGSAVAGDNLARLDQMLAVLGKIAAADRRVRRDTWVAITALVLLCAAAGWWLRR